jgi:hypothetical protein
MFQYGDPFHPIMGKFFNVRRVIEKTNNYLRKKTYRNYLSAEIDAKEHHKISVEDDYITYYRAIKSKDVICSLEREAKNAIRHRYRFTYDCTYKVEKGCD